MKCSTLHILNSCGTKPLFSFKSCYYYLQWKSWGLSHHGEILPDITTRCRCIIPCEILCAIAVHFRAMRRRHCSLVPMKKKYCLILIHSLSYMYYNYVVYIIVGVVISININANGILDFYAIEFTILSNNIDHCQFRMMFLWNDISTRFCLAQYLPKYISGSRNISWVCVVSIFTDWISLKLTWVLCTSFFRRRDR